MAATIVVPFVVIMAVLRPPLGIALVLGGVVAANVALLELVWRWLDRRRRAGRSFLGAPLDDPLEGLPWRKRWEIGRAILRGEAVRDPRDAELAARAAEHQRRLAQAQGRPSWRAMHLLVAAGAVPAILFAIRGDGPMWMAVLGAGAIVAAAAQLLLRGRVERRAQAAERRNRELV